ncbi:MAG: response regulator [Chthoniobacterales bacterium]
MRRILIVDDEAGFTRMLKLNLETSGSFEVRDVNEGQQALEVAREFLPHIIFLDIVMPDIDGGDVAAQIRADASLKRVPIVFLTAIVGEDEARNSNAIGGYPFLAKPVSMQRLLDTIDQYTLSSVV